MGTASVDKKLQAACPAHPYSPPCPPPRPHSLVPTPSTYTYPQHTHTNTRTHTHKRKKTRTTLHTHARAKKKKTKNTTTQNQKINQPAAPRAARSPAEAGLDLAAVPPRRAPPKRHFDIKKEYKKVIKEGKKAKTALENAIEQHAEMVVENSEDVFDARVLARKLRDDIAYRVRQYSYSIMNNTQNYRDWLQEDYERKLKRRINQICRERDM